MSLITPNSFKSAQKKYKRVKEAYTAYEESLKLEFKKLKVDYTNFSLILVGIKNMKELLVYVKSRNQKEYLLIKTYEFCLLSGELGPKRIEGDGQVPEGLYEISNFNPESNYHLSIKVNYPNASDKILSNKSKPGGDIYIHGNCVSIGCIPITDEGIKELYVMCVETKNQGHKIPVYIFPFEMHEYNMTAMKENDLLNGTSLVKSNKSFWENLQKAFTYFWDNKKEIPYSINTKGEYIISKK